MFKTDIYRKQHDELLAVAGKIAPLLNSNDTTTKTNELLENLGELAAKLNTHLTMEDKALYPKLLSSNSEETIKTTNDFIEEMGGIKKVFEGYVSEWANPTAIKTRSDEFITATQGLFAALTQRIDKENTVLYPLADNL